MAIAIRKATIEDVAIISQLSEQLGYKASVEDTQHRLSILEGDINNIVLVATDDDIVIGWIHIFKTIRIESGAFTEIGGLVVDTHHRGKGIGRLLVQQAVQWTKHLGLSSLRVRTNTIRMDTHRFYENCGFTELKSQKVFGLKI